MSYNAWSQTFLGADSEMESTCTCAVIEWRRIHEENPGAKRIFAKLTTNEKTAYVALGSPIQNDGELPNAALFLPNWVLSILAIEGTGEAIEVEWLTEEYFPEATRIVLRPHDSAFFHADAKEELERVLTRMGVLQTGITIPVPLQELGGFAVQVDVVLLEPTNLVLMQGDEVSIEFENALDQEVAQPVAQEVAPIDIPEPIPDVSSMIAEGEPTAQPPGHVLGGVVKKALPDGRPWNPWR